jgi:hypothetical protein
MTDAEKVIYFERLSQMTVDEFMAQSEAQQRQDVRNNKTEAINLRGKMNENINTLNEKVEAYFEEKYAHLPENERQDAIEKATDDWYKKRAQANGQEKEPPNLSEEDKLKWQQEQMTAYAERLRQIAEQEQDPKLRDILLKQAENVENDAKLANVTDNANRIEGKPEITREDAQTTITDAGRVNDLNKKLHANAASYSANLSQEQRAEVDATTKQTFATSDKTLSVDASTLKDSGTKMALNEARVDNLEAGKEAYQASVAAQTGVDAGLDFGNDTPSTVTTAQAEPPRLSQDLSQLQRAQQMMAEFDANGQKPANDAEGPKVATVKGPTVSNG